MAPWPALRSWIKTVVKKCDISVWILSFVTFQKFVSLGFRWNPELRRCSYRNIERWSTSQKLRFPSVDYLQLGIGAIWRWLQFCSIFRLGLCISQRLWLCFSRRLCSCPITGHCRHCAAGNWRRSMELMNFYKPVIQVAGICEHNWQWHALIWTNHFPRSCATSHLGFWSSNSSKQLLRPNLCYNPLIGRFA